MVTAIALACLLLVGLFVAAAVAGNRAQTRLVHDEARRRAEAAEQTRMDTRP